MKILIVRHGPAGDKEAWAEAGKPDALRPLTREGKEKTRKAAKGLARVCAKPALIASSRLRRAAQTAEAVAKAFGAKDWLELAELEPGAAPAAARRWLSKRKEKSVALVGHEPHLGRLIALLCAARRPVTELKKGQACLLELPAAGPAEILWSIAPAQLRRLGRGR